MIYCFAWTIFFFIAGSVLAVASVTFKGAAFWAVAAVSFIRLKSSLNNRHHWTIMRKYVRFLSKAQQKYSRIFPRRKPYPCDFPYWYLFSRRIFSFATKFLNYGNFSFQFFGFGAMCVYGLDCYLKFLAWKNNETARGGGNTYHISRSQNIWLP